MLLDFNPIRSRNIDTQKHINSTHSTLLCYTSIPSKHLSNSFLYFSNKFSSLLEKIEIPTIVSISSLYLSVACLTHKTFLPCWKHFTLSWILLLSDQFIFHNNLLFIIITIVSLHNKHKTKNQFKIKSSPAQEPSHVIFNQTINPQNSPSTPTWSADFVPNSSRIIPKVRTPFN